MKRANSARNSRRTKSPAKRGIHIKKKRAGTFRAWAKRHHYSMSTAIRKGLRSRSVSIRRKANFARNAKKWRH